MDFRRYSPEQQVSLYKQAISLREERGWGKQRIAKALGLSNDTVKGWIYRGYSTLNKFNDFDNKPSYELGYVIGTVWGDGNLYYDKTCGTRGAYLIRLKVKDLDFANEFNRCIYTTLHKNKPYAVISSKDGLYMVKCSCKSLFMFLERPLEEQKSIIEGSRETIIGSIRGFFDAEGGAYFIGTPTVRCYNSNRELLEYIKQLLLNYFNIISTTRLVYEKGRYNKKHDAYELEIRRYSEIVKFYDNIGFAIGRKQQMLGKITKWIEAKGNHGNRK